MQFVSGYYQPRVATNAWLAILANLWTIEVWDGIVLSNSDFTTISMISRHSAVSITLSLSLSSSLQIQAFPFLYPAQVVNLLNQTPQRLSRNTSVTIVATRCPFIACSCRAACPTTEWPATGRPAAGGDNSMPGDRSEQGSPWPGRLLRHSLVSAG